MTLEILKPILKKRHTELSLLALDGIIPGMQDTYEFHQNIGRLKEVRSIMDYIDLMLKDINLDKKLFIDE